MCSDTGEYILAMYDIRGKQDYIYKSSKIKEIVGGSYIIRDCFEDCLFPAAEEVSEEEQEREAAYTKKGIFSYRREAGTEEEKAFTPKKFQERLNMGYIGEVIYDGGGNFFVLYKNIEVYRNVNRRFYHNLLEKTYSLRVLTTYIENINFEDYPGDQSKIYARHHKREQQESIISPVNTLPVVQTDYRTSLPLAEYIGSPEEKVSYESKRKYGKYEEIKKAGEEDRQIQGSDLLDEMVTKKGEESLLAVIYIDGNNMGAQVEKCLKGLKSYEACTKKLREFSEDIQKYYIADRISEVDALLAQKEKSQRRFVVYAGDEVTIICNARNAYDLAVGYLTGLADSAPEGENRTSCAGIAVFHSHAPFPEAYRIAEECCESGKKLMKKEGIEHASLIDFHYCQGAFGTSLEQTRKEEGTEENSRPWFVNLGKKKCSGIIQDQYVSCEVVQRMKEVLNNAGRSNIKNLAFSAKKSEADFKSELERIRAHQLDKNKNLDFSLGGLLNDKMQRKLIYDMVIVYDLWFAKKDTKSEEEGEGVK